MKKLSVLIALALVLTIGGAYAAWSFAGGAVDPQSTTIGITMVTPDETTDAGVYSFENNTLAFTVDGGTTNTSALQSSGSITIKLVVDPSADSSIYTGALPTTLTVTVTQGDKYGEEFLLSQKVANTIPVTWGEGVNGVFTATIEASAIANCVTLAAINLPTKADYDTYAGLLANYKINLTVAPTP